MKGFTLIELLVTTTIVTLVTGVSLSAYLTFNENKQLDIDARKFNTLLNKVRSKAVFLEYPSSCTGLSSFEVTTDLNASGERKIVRSFANCSEGVVDTVSEELLSSSVFTANFNLIFLPQSGNLQSQADAEITIQGTKGKLKTKDIVVNQFFGVNNVVRNEE